MMLNIDMLTVTQVADILNIDRRSVINFIKSGQLKAYNISGGKIKPIYRIDEEDFERFKKEKQA